MSHTNPHDARPAQVDALASANAGASAYADGSANADASACADGSANAGASAYAAAIAHDLFCQSCGYNLRGLTSHRCPECGHSLDSVRAIESRIPWVRRHTLGWFRAYWRTVWLVMFRQRLFCEEMARPVSYGDAQRFRWVTILHVYVPLAGATLVHCIDLWTAPASSGSGANRDIITQLWIRGVEAGWPMVVLQIPVLLYLAAATGVPSYFFHPRGLPVAMQNRAIALSYYASGALAVSALPIAVGAAAYLLGLNSDLGMFLACVAATVPCGQLIAWFLDLTHICRRILPQFERRVWLIGSCVPMLWLGLAGVILIGLPAVGLYIAAVFVTLA